MQVSLTTLSINTFVSYLVFYYSFSTDACQCFQCTVSSLIRPQREVESEVGPTSTEYQQMCADVPASPCTCLANRTCMVRTDSTCKFLLSFSFPPSLPPSFPASLQCSEPFVGNGMLCTLDSDYDGFPDIPLPDMSIGPNVSICSSSPVYCRADNCNDIYNPDQDLSLCNPQPVPSGGCVCVCVCVRESI